MVTETKRIELRNWFAFAEKSWETEGEASPYTIDEALKVSRMWELLNIADDLSDEEYTRLLAMPAEQIDWSDVKDIKKHYRLTWIELRWIAKFERDGVNHLFDDIVETMAAISDGTLLDHADPVSTDVQ